MSSDPRASLRVGAVVTIAFAVAGVALFLLGDRQNLFRAKNTYVVRFTTVSGLGAGASVQLNGVDVGQVRRVVLPEDMGQDQIEVFLEIDARYEQRIRADSQARIKTLGLLGDKYLELTSGSPGAPLIPEHGEIPTAPMTSVDQLVASGEDLMANILTISSQLTSILGRMDRGEGLLGELTSDAEPGSKLTEELHGTLVALRSAAEKIESGPGLIPKLLQDPGLAERVESSVTRVDSLLARAEEGEGMLPALLSDAAQKEKLVRTLDAFERAAQNLSALTEGLGEGDALLPKLLADDEFGKKVAGDLERLLGNLATISEKLAHGQGTAARLIDDPTIYEAANDILIGIDESKFLRWLVRSRQKKGIRSRYDAAHERGEAPHPRELPAEDPGANRPER